MEIADNRRMRGCHRQMSTTNFSIIYFIYFLFIGPKTDIVQEGALK